MPLLSASNLTNYIIGTVLETFDIEAAISKYGKGIAERVLNQGATLEDAADELYVKLQGEGVRMNTFTVENIYTESPQGQSNRDSWYCAQDLATGRASVGEVSACGNFVGSFKRT